MGLAKLRHKKRRTRCKEKFLRRGAGIYPAPPGVNDKLSCATTTRSARRALTAVYGARRPARCQQIVGRAAKILISRSDSVSTLVAAVRLPQQSSVKKKRLAGMLRMKCDLALRRQLEGYRLATAEILYHLPDHPGLLQSYVWQDYDLAPRFPVLSQFLAFWMRELEGPLHSVRVAGRRVISANEIGRGTLFSIQ